MPAITKPTEQVWIAFNHVPGGQRVAQHFEDLTRRQRGPFGEKEILFTAREQVEGFRKSDSVALLVDGKIMKNEILIYDGPNLLGDPNAALRVLEWSWGKGHRPIQPAKDKEPLAHEQTRRIEHLERRMGETDSKIDRILELLENKKKEEMKK